MGGLRVHVEGVLGAGVAQRVAHAQEVAPRGDEGPNVGPKLGVQLLGEGDVGEGAQADDGDFALVALGESRHGHRGVLLLAGVGVGLLGRGLGVGPVAQAVLAVVPGRGLPAAPEQPRGGADEDGDFGATEEAEDAVDVGDDLGDLHGRGDRCDGQDLQVTRQ